MNVYQLFQHHRPLLLGTTEADTITAKSMGFPVDLFIHPGGIKEWAIGVDDVPDNLNQLPGWVSAGDTVSERSADVQVDLCVL